MESYSIMAVQVINCTIFELFKNLTISMCIYGIVDDLHEFNVLYGIQPGILP